MTKPPTEQERAARNERLRDPDERERSRVVMAKYAAARRREEIEEAMAKAGAHNNEIIAAVEASSSVRETLFGIIAEECDNSGDIRDEALRAAVDRILAAFALIPKEPTDGIEVEVPQWVVDQIKAEVETESEEAWGALDATFLAPDFDSEDEPIR